MKQRLKNSKMITSVLIVAIVVIAALATRFVADDDCSIAAWWTANEPVTDDFFDTTVIAMTAPVGVLEPLLRQMLDSQTRIAEADVAPCVADVHGNLLATMQQLTNGFNQRLQGNEDAAADRFRMAFNEFSKVTTVLNAHDVPFDNRLGEMLSQFFF
ncbi:MAG: hypothetical protein D6737_14615 [Chloroflexi bacterium]|nr:MAG: hypothetical protein D6737_14615 [Chloroflexota bacterium]